MVPLQIHFKLISFLPDAFLDPDLCVVARGAVLVLEQMEECADGEADREGGTSRSPVWAWLTLRSCALGGRASADGAVKTGLRAFGQISQLDRDATGKQKVEKSGLFGFVWVWFVSLFF